MLRPVMNHRLMQLLPPLLLMSGMQGKRYPPVSFEKHVFSAYFQNLLGACLWDLESEFEESRRG